MYPYGQNWVYSDGTIGGDIIHLGKYPELDEILDGYMHLAKKYPFLDMVVSYTTYDECICQPSCQTKLPSRHYVSIWLELQYQQHRFAHVKVMIYLTGDCHGDFYRFTKRQRLKLPFLLGDNDYVIVCGDLGLLWVKDEEFAYNLEWLSAIKS